MALGSYSAPMLRPLGISLDIYPAKSYSVTLPVANEDLAYNVSLTDDEYKLVFSRLGERMRIAGTAELNGYNTDLNLGRCQAILRRVPGHGTLGWTHSCGSGRALADIVSGRQPEVDFAFTGARSAGARSAGVAARPWRPAPRQAAIGPARRT